MWCTISSASLRCQRPRHRLEVAPLQLGEKRRLPRIDTVPAPIDRIPSSLARLHQLLASVPRSINCVSLELISNHAPRNTAPRLLDDVPDFLNAVPARKRVAPVFRSAISERIDDVPGWRNAPSALRDEVPRTRNVVPRQRKSEHRWIDDVHESTFRVHDPRNCISPDTDRVHDFRNLISGMRDERDELRDAVPGSTNSFFLNMYGLFVERNAFSPSTNDVQVLLDAPSLLPELLFLILTALDGSKTAVLVSGNGRLAPRSDVSAYLTRIDEG